MSEQEVVSPDGEQQKSPSFWSELKRRHVVRVASVYAVVAWLIIQVAGTTFERFGIPDWAFRFVVIMLVLGFPISLIIAWALELTPEGIKLTRSARKAPPEASDALGLDRKRRWLPMAFAAAVPALIFGSLALVFYLRLGGNVPFANPSAQSAVEQSIAVLPLTNLSADPENAFFAGGVYEDILTYLSRIDGLKVISRTSVVRYISSELSLRDIGEALGVRYIVEGSVRRINNHVRVTVQLIDASADTHLWANNYDRELVDIFATQTAVAKEISNSLHLEIQPETVVALRDMPTHSVKAYDLYIKARSIDRSETQSESSLIRQREMLEAAVAEDPGFVEAWANLNEVYDLCLETLNRQGWFVPDGVSSTASYWALHEKGVHALKKAYALDPENIETLIARAGGIVGEEAILADSGTEVELNPALRKEVMDYAVGKYPDSAMVWYNLGWWHYIFGSSQSAAKSAFEKVLQLDPLHARIVEGSLSFYRLAGDEAMVALLFERLAQIAPEKGKDTSLASLNTAAILEKLKFTFSQTADPSLLDIYAEELAKDDAFFDSDTQAHFYQADLWQMRNNMQALLELNGDPVLLARPLNSDLLYYFQLNTLAGKAQKIAGQPENIEATSRRIVNHEQDMVRHAGFGAAQMAHLMAEAYAVLGELEKAQQWTDRLFEEGNTYYDPWGGFAVAALSTLDIDRAVKMLLDREASNPEWNATDWFALLHISFRPLLVHPDMQEFYVKEGKWIDYLARRLPEYGK